MPKLLSLFLSLLVLFPAQTALADTGPKPSMDFQFKQAMTGEPPLTITSGILYECDQSDCSDAMPLAELGPQRFTCEVNSCRALAYGFAPYHRIEIEFSDGKTLQSNIFESFDYDLRREPGRHWIFPFTKETNQAGLVHQSMWQPDYPIVPVDWVESFL